MTEDQGAVPEGTPPPATPAPTPAGGGIPAPAGGGLLGPGGLGSPDTKKKAGDDEHRSVILRGRPKIIYLYPTLVVALIAAAWTYGSLASVGGDWTLVSLGPGRLFWWVFSINLLALAFDFTRGEFVALILFFGVTILTIVLLDQQFELVKPVSDLFSKVQLFAHPHLYIMLALALGVCFVGVEIQARFDYWEITHNEVFHHKGFLGDTKRYPAPNLRVYKELPDLFEYCLFFPLGGAGRVVLNPQGADRPIVLDNVIGVGRIEERIQVMLSSLQVKIDFGHAGE